MAKTEFQCISRATSILLAVLRHPAVHLFMFLLGVAAIAIAIHILGLMANAIHRYPLGLESTWSISISEFYSQCKASDPDSWGYGTCSDMVGCYLDKVPELQKADMAIRSMLAALFPTVMVLISSDAKELVSQVLISPHRALATALFTVGTPAAMLQKLKPVQRGLLTGDGDPNSYERTWVIPIACITKGSHTLTWRSSWQRTLASSSLSATMLYGTWTVNVSTVVPWKCECPLGGFLASSLGVLRLDLNWQVRRDTRCSL